MNYRLSPSDLTFLYEGCKHCFVLKVKYGISQPSIPLPAVFSTIALLQKDYYSDKRTEDFCPGLPPGIVRHGEKKVKSETIELPDCKSMCSINGRFDIVAELDDNSYAVLDFKTGNPNEGKSEMYGRQLHAYALALEKPVPDSLKLGPITKMGLLYFIPDTCEQSAKNRQTVEGEMKWIEIRRNDPTFLNFLKEVVDLLDGPLPEPQPDNCDWCSYHAKKESYVGAADKKTSNTNQSAPDCPTCNGPMRMKDGKYGQFWSCMSFPACRGTRNV